MSVKENVRSGLFIGLLAIIAATATQWGPELGQAGHGAHLTAADILLGIVFLYWAALVLQRRADVGLPPLCLWGWAGISMASLTAALLGAAASSQYKVDVEQMKALVSVVQIIEWLGVTYMLVWAGIRSARQARGAVLVLLAATAVVVVSGLVQYLRVAADQPYYVRSSFDNRSYYSGFLAMALPLLFGYALSWEKPKISLGIFAVVFAGAVTILTPAAMIALVVGLLLVAARTSRRALQVTAAGLLAFGALAALALPKTYQEDFYRPAHFTFTDDLDGDKEKLRAEWVEWKAGLYMLQEYPLLGVGSGSFQRNLQGIYGMRSLEYPSKSVWGPDAYAGRRVEPGVHNLYIVKAAETGLLGLLAMLWVLFYFGKTAASAAKQAGGNRLLRGLAVGTQAGIIAFAITSIQTSLMARGIGVLLGVLFGLAAVLNSKAWAVAEAAEPAPDGMHLAPVVEEEAPAEAAHVDEDAHGAVGKKVARATFQILFGQFAQRLLGLVEKPLMAARFGTGAAADAFGATVSVLFQFLAIVEQLLQHSFMRPFIETRTKEGESEGWKVANVVLTVVFAAFMVISLVILFATPMVVGLLTNFKNPITTNMTVDLLRKMWPAALILPVTSLTYVVLNSYKVFGLPAAADVVFKSGTVIALLFFAGHFGVTALAIGVVLGTVAKLAIHLFGLRDKLLLTRLSLDFSNPTVKMVVVLAGPLLISNILAAFRPTWDNWLASGLVGAIAALRYGRALVDTPAQILPLALRRALFPFMSEMAVRDEKDRLTEVLVRSMRVVFVVFVPMTVAMLLLRYPIVEAVYQWGQFGEDSTALVVPVLTFLAFGLIAIGSEMILLEPYFAMRDTLTPTIIGAITFVIHIGLTYAAVRYLGWGAGGIALGYTIARTIKILILAFGLRKRLARVDPRPLLSFGVKLGVAVAVMGVVMSLVASHPVFPTSLLTIKKSQLKDHSRLVATLADPKDARAPLSRALVAKFDPDTRDMLDQYFHFIDPPQPLKEAMAADLNRLVQGKALFENNEQGRALFENVKVKDPTWDLWRKSRQGAEESARFNRALLDDAFNNKLPTVKEIDKQPAAAFLYTAADLDHRARFLGTIRDSKEPLAAYIREQLSPQTREQLQAFDLSKNEEAQGVVAAEGGSVDPTPDVRDAVARELTKAIQGPVLYDPQLFQGVALSDETQKLIARKPSGSQRVWLNRALLREAYHGEIAPASKFVDLIRLSVPSFFGVLIFVALCMAMKLDEAVYLFGTVLKKLKSKLA